MDLALREFAFYRWGWQEGGYTIFQTNNLKKRMMTIKGYEIPKLWK